ncbi:hypothetical protein ACJX0J_012947, partial [Zea mays]
MTTTVLVKWFLMQEGASSNIATTEQFLQNWVWSQELKEWAQGTTSCIYAGHTLAGSFLHMLNEKIKPGVLSFDAMNKDEGSVQYQIYLSYFSIDHHVLHEYTTSCIYAGHISIILSRTMDMYKYMEIVHGQHTDQVWFLMQEAGGASSNIATTEAGNTISAGLKNHPEEEESCLPSLEYAFLINRKIVHETEQYLYSRETEEYHLEPQYRQIPQQAQKEKIQNN